MLTPHITNWSPSPYYRLETNLSFFLMLLYIELNYSQLWTAVRIEYRSIIINNIEFCMSLQCMLAHVHSLCHNQCMIWSYYTIVGYVVLEDFNFNRNIVTPPFDQLFPIKIFVQTIKHQNQIKFCTSKRNYFSYRPVIKWILKLYFEGHQ